MIGVCLPSSNSPFIDEVAVVERISEDELHAVFVHLVAVQTFYAVLKKKFSYVSDAGIAFCVQLKGRLYDGSFLLINDDESGARIVEITNGSSAGELATLRLLPQASRRIGTQIADILIGHAELNGHQKHVIGRIIAPVIGLNVRYRPPLQEPLDLCRVHRITS